MTFQIIDYSEGDWQVLLKNNKIVYQNHRVTIRDLKNYSDGSTFTILDEIVFDGTEDEWYEFIAKWEHDE